MSGPHRHLPLTPLLERLGPPLTRGEAAALGAEGCGRPKWVTAVISRARREGFVTVTMADRLAVEFFGLHPAELWPEWFEIAAADDDGHIQRERC